MTLKVQLNVPMYALYDPLADMYVYNDTGTPAYSTVPRYTCMAGSIEKVQKKKDRYVQRALDKKVEAMNGGKCRSADRFPETTEHRINALHERLLRAENFIIVRIDVTAV
jgi:hypothetical protein